MEKLIQYLNEYEDGMVSWVKEYVEEFGVFILNTEQMVEEEIIISKSFGFIQWLVDNDKIDFDKKDYPLRYNSYYPDRFGIVSIGVDDYEEYLRVDYDRCETLLMLLAISDTPIEDLVSYLR